MTDLFTPLTAGDLQLKNRIIMAPLTRSRAGDSRIPNAMMAEYYAQRASAGLIISEATAISPMGYGWKNAPAIYNDEQAAGWRLVTDAVHQAGGKIALQLWHMGRVSHPDFHNGKLPVAPSAIAAEGANRSIEKDYVVPHALTAAEIKATVQDYAHAARRAVESGFDGVEIHGANGYLIDQFLKQSSNQRTDEYGGSIANRSRFLLEVVAAVTKEIGAGRTGIRVSAVNGYNSMQDDDLPGLFTHVAKELNQFNIAFLEVKEPASAQITTPHVRENFKGILIVNEGYDLHTATDAVKLGKADAVAFGHKYVSNPDLVERFRNHAQLNDVSQSTLYGGGPEGYVDYPFMADRAA
jgi:2,4-dienoyl-CoA reductase-like NADH-dependent reductase (Old Yellow Enzyme family)